MIALVLESMVASALLMLLVLALRGPVRRAFGAQVAYALWAIPVLRLLLPPLPASWHTPIAAPITQLGHETIVMILPVASGADAAGGLASVAWSAAIAEGAILLWLAGAGAFLLWQVVRYAAFCRRLLADSVQLDRIGAIVIVESAAAVGPLAFGVARRFVAFPRDFAARYDAQERDLALAHELGHHRRGDIAANWIALAVLALHWFNPVAWIAFRAFRADQEMANDAGVLARSGSAARHAYGCAIVKAAHGHAVTAACHLHNVKDLKGRLRMLGNAQAGRARTIAGAAASAAVAVLALGVTASGTQAAARMREQVENVTGVEMAALGATMDQVAMPPAPPWPASPPMPSLPDLPTPVAAQKVPGTIGEITNRTKVVVVTDGKAHSYEGTAADDYLAAHALPVPPLPPRAGGAGRTGVVMVRAPNATVPTPPMPPYPPVPGDVRATVSVVTTRDCRGDPRQPTSSTVRQNARREHVTVICTDQLERAAERAAEAQLRATDAERRAVSTALFSLERARARIVNNRHLRDEQRDHALAGIDEALTELRTTDIHD